MTAELFANAYTTTLNGSLASGTPGDVLTVTVNDSPPSALTAAGQFRAVIDSEYFLVTAVTGTGNKTWTATRGQEGTSSPGHANGAAVLHIVTAGGLGAAITNARNQALAFGLVLGA